MNVLANKYHEKNVLFHFNEYARDLLQHTVNTTSYDLIPANECELNFSLLLESDPQNRLTSSMT